jgi:sialic acid synthase SpsE
MLILDFGSGNTCHNDESTIRDMFYELDKSIPPVFQFYQPVVKFQLFRNEPPNEPLTFAAFDFAYHYGRDMGFKVTASVFDMDSLMHLINYDVPFIKIANRPDLGELADVVRAYDVEVVQSVPSAAEFVLCREATPLCCVSEYPAKSETYVERFEPGQIRSGVSDHTVGWDFYRMYKPKVIEKHYVLEHSEDNPDAGPFAVTPTDVAQLYNEARP